MLEMDLWWLRLLKLFDQNYYGGWEDKMDFIEDDR